MIKTREIQTLGNVQIFRIDDIELKRSLHNIARRISFGHSEVKDVILFGSFSTGSFTPGSDLDVAIIMSDTAARFLDRPGMFIGYFSELDLDVSLVVYTVDEFELMLKAGNKFIQEIRKGETL